MGTRATCLILSFGVAGLLAQDIVPPMPAPKLGSTDPIEVSWAAWQAGAKAGDKDAAPAVVQALRIALRRLRHARDEASQYAVLQILHALVLHGADLSAGELKFTTHGLASAVRLELLRHSRDVQSLELLCDEWLALDPASPLWEVLGEHLVARGHRGACQRVLDELRPELVVLFDRDPWQGNQAVAFCWDGWPQAAGQPPLPVYEWSKDGVETAPRGVGMTFQAVAGGRARAHSRVHLATAPDSARIRWLSTISGRAGLAQFAVPLRVDPADPAPVDQILAERDEFDAELARARVATEARSYTVAGGVWHVADDRVQIVDRR